MPAPSHLGELGLSPLEYHLAILYAERYTGEGIEGLAIRCRTAAPDLYDQGREAAYDRVRAALSVLQMRGVLFPPEPFSPNPLAYRYNWGVPIPATVVNP